MTAISDLDRTTKSNSEMRSTREGSNLEMFTTRVFCNLFVGVIGK